MAELQRDKNYVYFSIKVQKRSWW